MRAVTATLYLYHFDELDEGAKESAREFFRLDPHLWAWQSEWWESALAFSRVAPITITEADYGASNVRVRWDGDEDVAELSGLRAWKWLQNNGPKRDVSWLDCASEEAQGNCGLTGFCGDAPFFNPIAEIQSPTDVPTLRELFEDCADRWMREANQDFEHAHSDEGIDGLIRCNEYEFFDTGELA